MIRRDRIGRLADGIVAGEAFNQSASAVTVRCNCVTNGGIEVMIALCPLQPLAAPDFKIRRFFQNCSSRREEAPYSMKFVKFEPRYLGCYGVLKEAQLYSF